MSIQPLLKMGNQHLATPSVRINDLDKSWPELLTLIQNMKDTMVAEGGVGIAAPQIGCNQRVIMFGFDSSQRYPLAEAVPFTVLINPTITVLSNEMVDGWEGCLSVPGLRGKVSRYQQIEYSGFDQEGRHLTRIAEGFHARVVQHECDHLDGILYPQRIKDLRFFGFEDELVYL